MVPAASTSFVSVMAAAQIPPASEAVPPSVANDLQTNRSVRERELLSALGLEGIAAPCVAQNEKAVAVIGRVQAKLSFVTSREKAVTTMAATSSYMGMGGQALTT
ncbi:hypothetical protein PF010_g23183 [Phytophthora fragariae]|uniref:Uncharacterized protein n=1 Tax=Phytophthora fragariae TaxID=53985 RepID=A0A6G0MZV4_9STRA|nr:hypothetical protein PF010_g23183 [Phytophthora fragariae]KAE9187611.1 hypothetical protein PF004_g22746 [Phytophthora fragariae]